jgi:hypothetical protein
VHGIAQCLPTPHSGYSVTQKFALKPRKISVAAQMFYGVGTTIVTIQRVDLLKQRFDFFGD